MKITTLTISTDDYAFGDRARMIRPGEVRQLFTRPQCPVKPPSFGWDPYGDDL